MIHHGFDVLNVDVEVGLLDKRADERLFGLLFTNGLVSGLNNSIFAPFVTTHCLLSCHDTQVLHHSRTHTVNTRNETTQYQLFNTEYHHSILQHYSAFG